MLTWDFRRRETRIRDTYVKRLSYFRGKPEGNLPRCRIRRSPFILRRLSLSLSLKPPVLSQSSRRCCYPDRDFGKSLSHDTSIRTIPLASRLVSFPISRKLNFFRNAKTTSLDLAAIRAFLKLNLAHRVYVPYYIVYRARNIITCICIRMEDLFNSKCHINISTL